jgi:hypothetical protein
MSDIEAIGDAITGGVIGRAVEPKAGESADGHTHEHNCLNCGAALTGPFCQQCGQHAHVHRTLAAFFHDFAHGVLHFEGKIWRTLPLLAWKPGALTRRYIDGQRASFVSPVALFLFAVFLMFAVLSATGNLNPNLGTSRNLAAQQHNLQGVLAQLQKTRSERAAKGKSTRRVDADIRDTQETLELIGTMRERGVTSAVLNKNSTVETKVPLVKEAFLKAKENPELLLYKLKSNSYKWSWALIPLSVPFVWLLFPFSRRFRLYDHVVFVTYSLSFMTLLMAAGALVSAIGIGQVAAVIPFIPPIHMYRQLRGAYAVSRFGALWRTALLLLFAVVVLTGFILLMAALGVFD